MEVPTILVFIVLRHRIPIAMAAIWAAFFVAAPALAQTYCGSRDSILAGLSTNYAERPVAMGLTNAGLLVEVLVSGDGASWTMIATNPNGITCVVQTGEDWQSFAPPTPGEGR